MEGTYWETRHLCHNRKCVSPEHTKRGTSKENKADSKKSVCRNGHDITLPGNVFSYFFKKENRVINQCRICHKVGQAAAEERRRLKRQLGIRKNASIETRVGGVVPQMD
jgi:hypothetical protein